MSFGQGLDAGREGLALAGRRLAEGLSGHRLHRAQRVLDAMLDFVEQQLLDLFGFLALFDLDLGCPVKAGIVHGRRGLRCNRGNQALRITAEHVRQIVSQ